ncbi:MAG: 30S ribosomal protein S17 [Gammaproteobacteria bacterium]
MNEKKKTGRTLVGQVVSNGMDKTISVLVERRVVHPIYRKYLRKSSKILAHDENNECNKGDLVSIEACRQISKHKSWQLQHVLKRATQV